MSGRSLPTAWLALLLCSCSCTHASLTDRGAADAAGLPRVDLGLDDRAAWRAVLAWPEDCEAAFEATRVGTDAGLAFHELEPGVSLVAILCALGSYQPSHLFQFLDERGSRTEVRLVAFPSYESADGRSLEETRVTELWGEFRFLPQSRELTVLQLSRQTRDCGTWARYAFPDGRPQLREFRALVPCPGAPGDPVDPEPGQAPLDWTEVEER